MIRRLPAPPELGSRTIVSLLFTLSALCCLTPPARATFPGTNGRIVFGSDRDGDFEIYTMNADGSGVVQLTTNTATDRMPAWSPDGSKIVFTSDRDGDDEVFVMNADGSGQTQLTFNTVSDSHPVWSPDGTKIAFTADGDPDGDYENYVMNANGTGRTQITFNTAPDFVFGWSPDGTHLASVRGAGSSLEVWTMKPDGTDQTQLTFNGVQDSQPRWSPDGSKILFKRELSFGSGWAELFTMNPDGTGQTNVTNTATLYEGEGAFSPDGSKIVLNSTPSSEFEISVMNADGTGRTQITSVTGFDGDLDWGTTPNVIAPGSPGSCISIAQPCVVVPMTITRSGSAPARGFSVTLQLSAELMLCAGTASINEGTYLSSVGATTFQVHDNGGGSYTVDGAILGLPCGATAASGTLFDVAVKNSGADGIGSVTVTAVKLRDCANVALPTSAGAPATVTIDRTAPASVVLSAVQKLTGNLPPGSSTTDVTVSFGAPEAGATVAVYRKGFGGYPQYDENGGAVPSTPATPSAAAGAGWALTTVTSSPGTDRTATRDFYYYVSFVTDACGNVSGPSNMTGGTLNYHLGDVHNGVTSCVGNDLVNTSDISFLGSNYGITIPVNGALECLDVGPTTNNSVSARPTTDNKTDFEDLILFAINYGQVSKTGPAKPGSSTPVAIVNRLSLEPLGKVPAVGGTFAAVLRLESAGDLQGVSTQLDYDANVVEPVGVEAGALLSQQSGQGIVLSAKPGNVDVAVLGTGATITGDGELALVRFRVKAEGAPAIAIHSAEARDTDNHRVALDAPLAGGPVGSVTRTTGLAMSRPSPFRESTTLEYSLAHAGPVQLSIYSVDGRRIRTLVSGPASPGTFRITWDGRDESSHAMPAGLYYARFVTNEGRFTRTLVRVR